MELFLSIKKHKKYVVTRLPKFSKKNQNRHISAYTRVNIYHAHR